MTLGAWLSVTLPRFYFPSFAFSHSLINWLKLFSFNVTKFAVGGSWFNMRKDQLEASLHEEKKLIESGRLKEDNPLDVSESFNKLCEACRRGDLKSCQEMITTEGVNINARDRFDYTPLILVRVLCQVFHACETARLKPGIIGQPMWPIRSGPTSP